MFIFYLIIIFHLVPCLSGNPVLPVGPEVTLVCRAIQITKAVPIAG